MLKRFLYLIKYYLLWLVFFVLQKPVFMLWQQTAMKGVTCQDWLDVVYHGLPLDLSVAAYCTLFVGIWLAVSFWWRGRGWQRVVNIYTGLLFAVGIAVMLADNGCFPSWGYHLDKTLFVFLRTPKDALACAPVWVWLVGGVVYILLLCLCMMIAGWMQVVRLDKDSLPDGTNYKSKIAGTLCMLLMTGLLFFPIRGSVSVSTMNTGRVYFSNKQILNLAAINPVFNIVESLGENTFDVGKYTYMSTDEATSEVQELYAVANKDSASQSVLTTSRPNIVLLILESFSLNAWGAMPQMQRLANEGVFFSNIYASSYRTDRGVVAILSGFPGQPTSSLMTVPSKSNALPQLGISLAEAGYQTAFYYGGDEDFTNMRSYLIRGGFDDRLSDHSFSVQDRLSKWGVPDHIVLNRASKDIMRKWNQQDGSAKRLDVVLTLSSHEPFEVDYHHWDHPYLNSIAYTDSCVGAFVDQLRTSDAWDSLLVVMVADHGYPYPDGVLNHEPRRYRIPVVMCGGAVKQSMQVHTLGSQIDLVPTLLHQMGLSADEYTFGKDLLDTLQAPFAFYAYNDGFALIWNNDTVVVDAKANRMLIGNQPIVERKARAYMQRILQTIDAF